jgi:hypothetical protein
MQTTQTSDVKLVRDGSRGSVTVTGERREATGDRRQAIGALLAKGKCQPT